MTEQTERTWSWFVLDVNPEPWAIGPLSVTRNKGKLIPYVGRNLQLHAYKQAVKSELGEGHTLIVGPVELRFYFWRRRDSYTTPQARGHRKHEADVTNLQKSTEDALQGILFKNDKDTNDVRSVMVEQGANVHGRVVIAVRKGTVFPEVAAELPAMVTELISELNDPESEDDNAW
jgi:Holliday junction resolvase RusA-like endonuclease